MTIKSTSGVLISNIILKVDSGASVSLSHAEYLTDAKHCKLHGLPPVCLNDIGGKTEIMDLVGILNIIANVDQPDSQMVPIKCHAFDTKIGDHAFVPSQQIGPLTITT